MFKFLKEIKDSIKEGIAEAKEEVLAEEEVKATHFSNMVSKEKPDIKNIAIALSCPFREVLTAGDDLRLFSFGQLEEKEKQSLKKLLYRDFEIQDEESMQVALREMAEMIHSKGASNDVFKAAMNIYIITSAVDVGFITFEDYEQECHKNMKIIGRDKSINSWEDFAEKFMAGECINNAVGRKLLKNSVKKLLKEERSPWVIFSWDKVVSVLLGQEEEVENN